MTHAQNVYPLYYYYFLVSVIGVASTLPAETKLPPCSVKYQVLVFPAGGPFLASQPLTSLSLEASEAEGGFQPQRNEALDAQLSSLSECCRRWAWGGVAPDFLGWEETFSCLWTPPPSIPAQRFGDSLRRNDERGFPLSPVLLTTASSADTCALSHSGPR